MERELSFIKNDIYALRSSTSLGWATAYAIYQFTDSGDTMMVQAARTTTTVYAVARGILATSLAAYDSTQLITSATLTLYCTEKVGSDRDVYVYGYDGDSIAGDTESFNSYGDTLLGTGAGADQVEDTSITITLNADGLAYLNDHLGETEVAFMLRSQNDTAVEPGSTATRPYVRFASPEHDTLAYRPVLAITVYTEPQESAWYDGMDSTPVHRFTRGETLMVAATVKDSFGDDAEATSATVTITTSTGTEVVTDGDMTVESGLVYYYYNIPSDTVLGGWYADITVNSGTGDLLYSQKYKVFFEVVE